MKAQLIVVQGKPEGKIIPLAGPIFKIGRGETCHLKPSSEQVSREHAEFRITENQVSVRDLGSRNGTLVNGKALTEACVLKDRDLVQIGPLTFAVSIQGAAAPAPKSASVARTASPDDVSHDDIDSWLVADSNNPVPESPSGVYGGDTITVTAFKDTDKPDEAKPEAAEAKPEAAEAKPQPVKVEKPQAAEAKPQPVKVEKPQAAEAKPQPAKVEKPQAAEEKPQPVKAAKPQAPAAAEYDDAEYERLPEGEGDVEEGPQELEESDEDEAESTMLEDFEDSSNPFHVKKKQPDAPAKPVYKDSSDAASEILRKMLERRRSSK